MEKSPLKNTLYNRAETLARKQFLSIRQKIIERIITSVVPFRKMNNYFMHGIADCNLYEKVKSNKLIF